MLFLHEAEKKRSYFGKLHERCYGFNELFLLRQLYLFQAITINPTILGLPCLLKYLLQIILMHILSCWPSMTDEQTLSCVRNLCSWKVYNLSHLNNLSQEFFRFWFRSQALPKEHHLFLVFTLKRKMEAISPGNEQLHLLLHYLISPIPFDLFQFHWY